MHSLHVKSKSVALVGPSPGRGHHSGSPNPDGSKASQSHDCWAKAWRPLAGSFFQSMGTGGSLSRRGGVPAPALAPRSKGWAVCSPGLWLGLILLLFGSQAEKVPLAVIGGMLVVIGVELIMAGVPTPGWSSAPRLGIHCCHDDSLWAVFIPLQYTIFLGAALSLGLYLVAHHRGKSARTTSRAPGDGGWEIISRPRR